jgi:hypothetical protein
MKHKTTFDVVVEKEGLDKVRLAMLSMIPGRCLTDAAVHVRSGFVPVSLQSDVYQEL